MLCVDVAGFLAITLHPHNLKVTGSNPVPATKICFKRSSVAASQLELANILCAPHFIAVQTRSLTLPKRDPEIAEYDRRFRKEEEIEDIEAFLDA